LALIQQWKRRIFTPIGRVTVTKTLNIPKFNHLFISLPNPSPKIISNLATQLFRFIWDLNCDKFKRTLVTQHHLCGDLNMVNLKKDPWIQKTIKCSHSDSWLSISKHNYGQDVIDKLLNTGDYCMLKLLKSTSNTFWKDVLESWKFVTEGILKNKNKDKPV
jgi:hypothetical protein